MSTIQAKLIPLFRDAFVKQDLASLKEWSSQFPDMWKPLGESLGVHPMIYAYRHKLLLSFSFCVTQPKMPFFSFQVETVREESLRDRRDDCVELLECMLLKVQKTQVKKMRILHSQILR